MAEQKLSAEQLAAAIERRDAGESLRSISRDLPINHQRLSQLLRRRDQQVAARDREAARARARVRVPKAHGLTTTEAAEVEAAVDAFAAAPAERPSASFPRWNPDRVPATFSEYLDRNDFEHGRLTGSQIRWLRSRQIDPSVITALDTWEARFAYIDQHARQPRFDRKAGRLGRAVPT